MNTNNDYCIILAGGTGRRLWPVSRKSKPKQFLDFFGAGRTLLQQTFDRFARIVPPEHIFISTFEEYAPMVREQLPEVAEENILAEPVQLSTGPAVAWASYHIALLNPEANIVVTPSDQFILREIPFIEQMQRGLRFVADREEFLAVGMRPTMPNTSYGYIQKGDQGPADYLFRVKSFSEKPSPKYAHLFMESGEFLWNTGIFMWHVPTMIKLLSCVAPSVAQRIAEAKDGLTPDAELELVKRYYPANIHRSIDLVILEMCGNVHVFEGDFGWADVGSWQELYELERKDADGNAVPRSKQVILQGCSNSMVVLPEGLSAYIRGLDGYLVAQYGNSLVVCPNDDPAQMRHVVNNIQMTMGEEYV